MRTRTLTDIAVADGDAVVRRANYDRPSSSIVERLVGYGYRKPPKAGWGDRQNRRGSECNDHLAPWASRKWNASARRGSIRDRTASTAPLAARTHAGAPPGSSARGSSAAV